MDFDYEDGMPGDWVVVLPPRFAPFFKIPFRVISSAFFQVKDFKAEPYPQDLLDILLGNSVKDLAAEEDKRFLAMFKS